MCSEVRPSLRRAARVQQLELADWDLGGSRPVSLSQEGVKAALHRPLAGPPGRPGFPFPKLQKAGSLGQQQAVQKAGSVGQQQAVQRTTQHPNLQVGGWVRGNGRQGLGTARQTAEAWNAGETWSPPPSRVTT